MSQSSTCKEQTGLKQENNGSIIELTGKPNIHTISAGRGANAIGGHDRAKQQRTRFLNDFTRIISTNQFAHLKTDDEDEKENSGRQINVIVKRNHYAQIVYWIKNNLMVKSCYSKRKTYITTINVLLHSGDALVINLI